ncbi:GGDEF domain-containing protein [Sphingomonas bacterium]|uniref:GGDEF domain-containing protein n=1 Tax=Sphingomonas bacterium TaxID=1895847 RepID=UPI0015758E27|nr:GGDEF domain-containing protein [Sphingomonas bacterium]
MYHDPSLSRSNARRAGVKTWLRRLIGGGPDKEAVDHPPWEDAAVDPRSVDALAAALAKLIEAARGQLDGASDIVDRSADEVRDYGSVLAEGARMFGGADLPATVAGAVIEATETMLARTRRAEERLRGMSADLANLRRDLEEARALAERDPLTGLPNRRALDKALLAAIGGATAARQALSVAFCDIDNFKVLNDRHGHALGDRVLRLVSDCLTDGGGQDVFVGRHGGEEFVMMFDGAGAEQAALRVDAIRAQLATRVLRSKTDDHPIGNVTFSAGVAMLRDGELGEDLLQRADRALYRAKHNGRNRVEIDRES